MKVKFIIALLLLSTACQMGKIPCPRIKTAKLHKSTVRPSSSLLSARANPVIENDTQSQKTKDRPADARFVKNISVEEWDCPRPGAKRYMPRSVKENIRKNRKKIEEDVKNGSYQADSLSMR